MPRIPYTAPRRQTHLLKVRVPSDLVPILRRQHFVQSLQTSDQREARRTVPAALARVRRTWHDLRMDILTLLGKPLTDANVTEPLAIRPDDMSRLSVEERDQVLGLRPVDKSRSWPQGR